MTKVEGHDVDGQTPGQDQDGAVGELVGIDGGVVSGVINLESSGVEASDWRPRHDERYHEA
jgi:transposase